MERQEWIERENFLFMCLGRDSRSEVGDGLMRTDNLSYYIKYSVFAGIYLSHILYLIFLFSLSVLSEKASINSSVASPSS